MHIDAICETNGKGWLIWAAQCPGAFARGATENEALAKLPGDVRRFLRWAGEPAGDITVTPGAPIESSLHTEDADSDLLLLSLIHILDDAIALLTAHRQPGLEIVGLSTVAGNVTLDHTTENTLKICGLMGADYPVYPGAPGPLRRERKDASSFHGADGLGGAVLPAPRRAPEQTPAWDALYEAAARMPGELTLVATGPLTNAAIALTAHPALRSLSLIHISL